MNPCQDDDILIAEMTFPDCRHRMSVRDYRKKLMTEKPSKPSYTLGEEIANSITHGIGTAVSIAGLVILIVFAVSYGTAWHVVSFSVFGSALIILYLSSTLYHSIPKPGAKNVLKRIDHSAIFFLIAGTYTPFLLVSLRGPWGWSLFGVVWGLAIAGIVFKSIFVYRYNKMAIAVYIMMGWLILIASKEMLTHVQLSGILLLAIGGICYTAGVIFYVWRKLPQHHAIWHLFVLAGSTCHYFSVFTCLEM